MMTRTIRPSTDGKAPGSPVRSFPTYSRNAPGIVRVSTSRLKLLARSGRASPALVRSVDEDTSHHLVRGGGGEADGAAAAGGDQFDELGRRTVLLLYLGGDLAEVQRHDPVGDLHDVVHVVRDEHYPEARVGEAPD